MKIRLPMGSAAALALMLGACGGNDEASTTNNMVYADDVLPGNMLAENESEAGPWMTGQQYATTAAASDLYEIQSSEMAVDKAKGGEVKSFARMLIADHERSTADLKTAGAGAQPPVDVSPALDADGQADMDALRAASDADFERTWLSQQVAAHEKALAMVRAYAESGDVPLLKVHASTVSGPIEKHLARARELLAGLGK